MPTTIKKRLPAPVGQGLYLTEKDIARKLGFGEDFGRRLLHELDKSMPGRRPYPKKDPLFGNRRFWPAVFAWHMDYHGVRLIDRDLLSLPR